MIQSIHLFPHGMQIIPDLEEAPNDKFNNIHQAMLNTTIDSDVILLITPHGNALEEEYLIYNHNKFQGFYYKIKSSKSVVSGELHSSKSWRGSSEIVSYISDYLHSQIPVKKLTQGGETYPMTLAWGETVPLFYHSDPAIIVISIPRRRYNGIESMREELYKIGSMIVELSNNGILEKKRVALLISGDLSHTHLDTGPYGYHNTCSEFDELVQHWVERREDSQISQLLELNKTALSCGMAGMCILQGVFNKLNIKLDHMYYSVPTYFGMIVASWR